MKDEKGRRFLPEHLPAMKGSERLGFFGSVLFGLFCLFATACRQASASGFARLCALGMLPCQRIIVGRGCAGTRVVACGRAIVFAGLGNAVALDAGILGTISMLARQCGTRRQREGGGNSARHQERRSFSFVH